MKFDYYFSRVEDGNLDFRFGVKGEVMENRKKFLVKIGMRTENFVVLRVTHGDGMEIVRGKDRGREVDADALVTGERAVGMMLLTADCIPVIIGDESAGVLGLVHLGWQGVDKELVTKVVEKMNSLGGRDLRAVIGPGVRKESYVFEGRIVQANDSKWQPFLEKQGGGRTAIDLVGFIKKQLVDCGVKRIEDCGIDTAKNKNYFSHYRAVRTGELEGRFATVVMMK